MANILVPGGAGFIGSHTVLALTQAGHTVTVLDNLSNGHADSVIGAKLVVGELDDGALLERLFAEENIEAVIHFAAFIEAGQSVVDPLAFYRNNVGASLTLLQAMEKCGVRKIVFSSTAAVYGFGGNGLLREEAPKQPINPYGHSKWAVECMLRDVAATGAIDAIALRYFNAAGSDAAGRLGERHDPETHLIPLVLDAARGHRPDIKIFGTDYDTPDGTCIRDYIHVSDLASAHVKAVETLLRQEETGGYYDAFNLGTSHGYSVREVIDTVRDVTGRQFNVIETERRPGDPDQLVADATKAQSALGWRPEQSDLRTMIDHAWNFRKKL